jgi:hypothetical protein
MASYGYEPSPAEIDRVAAMIRRTWTETTRLDRLATLGRGRAISGVCRLFLFRGIDGRRISGRHVEIDGDEFAESMDPREDT